MAKKYEVREIFNGSLTDHLLFYRGIKTEKERQDFLNPNYDLHTHDPFLLKDCEKAVDRILHAIDKNETIVIYSDYDTDGIPAGVIMHDLFKKAGYNNFINYIPHRHDEGFGLNIDAIKKFKQDSVGLIITLDCGIADIEPVSFAKQNNIDVIVTDHHLPGKIIPEAYAIVNPKQTECNYPEKMLCGSGVGYKLIQGILKKRDFGIKNGWEKWLLDMVGIATLSDMVPLVGENRVFAYYGLQVLRKSPRKGLVRLLNLLKSDQRYLTEDDIGFTIGPRINAASRMGVPMDAFKLLATDSDDEAHLLAKNLDHINNERKGTVASLVKETKKKIIERYGEKPDGVIVIGNPDWKPSLLGLAANVFAEEFSCPVFLWGRDGDGIIKGSCRAAGSVHLLDLMNAVSKNTFIQFGGHAESGGFAISNEAIHHVEENLNIAYKTVKNLEKENIEYIDREFEIEDVNWKTYNAIEKLAPFGVGNPKPSFIFKNISISGIKEFGKEKNHLEFLFSKRTGEKVPAIGFFMNSESFKNKNGNNLKIGDKIDLVACMEKSNFRGRPELRLRIIDVV